MAVLEMYCKGKDRVLLTVLPSVHEPNACDMCEARRACTQRSPAAPKGAHLALKQPGCPMWKLRGSQEGHCHHCLHCPHLGESHPLQAGSKKGIKRVGRAGSCFLRGGQQGGLLWWVPGLFALGFGLCLFVILLQPAGPSLLPCVCSAVTERNLLQVWCPCTLLATGKQKAFLQKCVSGIPLKSSRTTYG